MSETLIRLMKTRIRGVSVIEGLAFLCLVILVIGVYLSKAGASQEGARISDLNREITNEQRDVRRLREELSRLEKPERIEQLSSQYLQLRPVSLKQEVRAEDLPAIARRANPPAPLVQPPASAAPTVASTAAAPVPAGVTR